MGDKKWLDPKSIANEHAAAFANNSFSAHYSATFQAIKIQDEKVRIDFTSDNTEVYNKPFRLRDLRHSILKAKPHAPGPDRIHNNLLKHLPEDTLKILKDILNNIWTTGDFPHQWRAATVIPIPKPNKDHADPNSYRPIALTSCLCKILERMINTQFIWLWWDSHLSFKKHIRALKTECKEALNLIRVVAHLKWGGDRDTLLMLYRAIVLSKLDYGCIVYGTASNTDLHQLDNIHNAGVRLALGAFCTSPVSSMYMEANEAPLEERRLKLSMHYYLKPRACTDNPAHHAIHEFDPTIRDLYLPRPNGRGGMTRPSRQPICLKLEETMIFAEINVELVCPLRTPSFPPGTHEYDPKKHNLIEGVSKCMITREEAQANFREYHDAQRPHHEVYTDGSKINERVGAAAVVNCHFQNGETICRQLSKRLPDNSSIFAAEATAIILALDYYRHMDPVQHGVVFYSDSMSCLQAIEGEDTENPLICHIMNLLWALSDKGTCVRFCWVPSHCGIEGNEVVDQLAKETLDQDINPLTTVHYADLKRLVNSYIKQEVQTKWDVSIHGRHLYLVKPTLGPPKKFQHLTRAEEVVITRLRIGHTKATKSPILSRGPTTTCQHCGQTLTLEHMLLECTVLQHSRDEYYTADSLGTLFGTVPEACIVEFLREAGFFYLIWMAIYPEELLI